MFRRALLLGVVTLAGCTRLDRAIGSVPWFTTMRDQIAVRPFEPVPGDTSASPYFLPPPGSVPVNGLEDSLDIFSPQGLRTVDAMANPMFGTLNRDRGGQIFRTYCAVCHGPEGKGNGTVAGRMGYVPDLTAQITQDRSDGYIYAILRHGRGVMPRYGDRIRDHADRWRVVLYVRHLQGKQP